VSNALRYTPAGGTIRLTARRSGQGIELAVANTGPGIAPEHLPHIFNRYYRADAARSSQAHSAGLGLSIVRAIMALHGGSVRVESVERAQTTFFLLFE